MNPFASMRRLHERGPSCRGLAVDLEGVTLGPHMMLVQRMDHGYRRVPAGDMIALARAAFGADARLERLPAVLAGITNALEQGDIVKAQLLALSIPIGVLDEGQLAQLAAIADLIKAGFDSNQPRDERGPLDGYRQRRRQRTAPAPGNSRCQRRAQRYRRCVARCRCATGKFAQTQRRFRPFEAWGR